MKINIYYYKLLIIYIAFRISVQKSSLQKEVYEFQSDNSRLMNIIITSLYSHKQIFIREILINASDSLEKYRYLQQNFPEIKQENDEELEIKIKYNQKEKTISITDNGIGMTKQDLISNLGIIAKTGTTKYIEAIKDGDINIVGQFGIGFYSCFLIAKKVQLISTHYKLQEQYIWESIANNYFSIKKVDDDKKYIKRGTKIILYLKEDSLQFLEKNTIENIIEKYSEFITFPVKIKEKDHIPKKKKKNTKKIEGKNTQKYQEKNTQNQKEKNTQNQKEKNTQNQYKIINTNSPIWLRPKEEIEDEEYIVFFKKYTKNTSSNPLTWVHFRNEKDIEFTSILFINEKAPLDLYENYYNKESQIKIYIRTVILENQEDQHLMPKYLNFIQGLVDSDDFLLNVNRENISKQKNAFLIIRQQLLHNSLELIRQMAEEEQGNCYIKEDDEDSLSDSENSDQHQILTEQDDDFTELQSETDQNDLFEELQQNEAKKAFDLQNKRKKYQTFYHQYGKSIKLGIIEDKENREKLAKMSRWYSSFNHTDLTSFEKYIQRAKLGQNQIYYLAGESPKHIMEHPTIQRLLKKGFEVLLLFDTIDEFVFQNLKTYKNYTFVNVGKGNFKFPVKNQYEIQKNEFIYQKFLLLIKFLHKLLYNDIEKVIISQRLLDHPCVILPGKQGFSAHMERIQSAVSQDRQNISKFSNQKKILEINPNHPAIQKLLSLVINNQINLYVEDIVKLMFEGSVINSGFVLRKPQKFAKRFYKMINKALGIPKNAPIIEYEINWEELTELDEDYDDLIV
ncbi:hypothetical protein IMG5_078890 [Ichthyophthirius multifiliis]|uniref:Histidine kinase/HSP90-like ATPase domain-containing protein n=1 Tax=Ichthyophthirius multifiliis TaxID=5932 RepID=G0QQH0_ICHMU|nr:hypothetical protein IMG5_078890 [Ichthyophthirius multifiliis]EGR32535.1 hypothetical protein IMG5_078890 [Ichthyophthirius multifiliis]|eukprot:XP_004036521.1 hypothetical protein IMG5_078890 [Ichthyophthirius multifiliis]